MMLKSIKLSLTFNDIVNNRKFASVFLWKLWPLPLIFCLIFTQFYVRLQGQDLRKNVNLLIQKLWYANRGKSRWKVWLFSPNFYSILSSTNRYTYVHIRKSIYEKTFITWKTKRDYIGNNLNFEELLNNY